MLTREPGRYRALALDYDETMADAGVVDVAVVEGLSRVKSTGRRIIMVTGRELDDLASVFPALDAFDRIVAENGGVLCSPTAGEIRAAAGPPDAQFVAQLRLKGAEPLAVGRAIVATRLLHERLVAETIRELGLDLDVILNRDSVMVLPRGVNKASGLLATLGELGIAPENVVGIGDAENDCDWLGACGCGIAVANAIPDLLRRADAVTRSRGGAGVLEVIEELTASEADPLDTGLTRRL